MTQKQYDLMRTEHTVEWIAAAFPRSVRRLAESGALPQDTAEEILRTLKQRKK